MAQPITCDVYDDSPSELELELDVSAIPNKSAVAVTIDMCATFCSSDMFD